MASSVISYGMRRITAPDMVNVSFRNNEWRSSGESGGSIIRCPVIAAFPPRARSVRLCETYYRARSSHSHRCHTVRPYVKLIVKVPPDVTSGGASAALSMNRSPRVPSVPRSRTAASAHVLHPLL